MLNRNYLALAPKTGDSHDFEELSVASYHQEILHDTWQKFLPGPAMSSQVRQLANWRTWLLCLLCTTMMASPRRICAKEVPSNDKNTQSNLAEREQQLVGILASIARIEADLREIDQGVATSNDDIERKNLSDRRDKLSEQYHQLKSSLEELATGGQKLADFTNKSDPKIFDWQKELLDIFKPMIAELKDLTERPRAIEALRGEKSDLESALPATDHAIEQLRKIKLFTKDPPLTTTLTQIESDWLKRQNLLQQKLQLVNFRLQELLDPPQAKNRSIVDRVKSFLWGRGLTIVLAALAFLVIYVVLTLIGRRIESALIGGENSKRRFFQRATRLFLQIFTILLSLLALIMVLYLRGDWLILGLIILVFIGIAWGLSQSLPRYLTVIKLLLNMGPVREGERVIYQGIPWMVTQLNMYTVLENPELNGGIIRLPVTTIMTLNTRPSGQGEPWFPCRCLDFVVLSDSTYGQIIMQTPDMVSLRLEGHSSKVYRTQDFLAATPRNLSNGFGIFLTFGLDYNLINHITRVIPTKLADHIGRALNATAVGKELLECRVEFKSANASSLDLEILVRFSGQAASEFLHLQRLINRCAVEASIEQSWNIPFPCVSLYSQTNEACQN